MAKLTYRQAYDLIINAYFKDEIQPMETEFCFCGTLSGGAKWSGILADYRKTPYTEYEYFVMEYALLTRLRRYGVFWIGNTTIPAKWCGGILDGMPGYEEALFDGMCDALEALKQIHINRGEVIDDVPVFTKRQKAVAV